MGFSDCEWKQQTETQLWQDWGDVGWETWYSGMHHFLIPDGKRLPLVDHAKSLRILLDPALTIERQPDLVTNGIFLSSSGV